MPHVFASGAIVLAQGCPNLARIEPIIQRASLAMLALLGASAVALAVYAGLRYAFSFGKRGGIEEAKGVLKTGAVGIGLGTLASAIVGVLSWVLGGFGC